MQLEVAPGTLPLLWVTPSSPSPARMGSPGEGRGARLGWDDSQDGDNGWDGMMAGVGVMARMWMRIIRDQGVKKRQQLPEEFSGSVCVVRRFYGLLVPLFVSRKSAQKSLLSPCRCAQREGVENLCRRHEL